jgi:CheY-like chemotaxis protein
VNQTAPDLAGRRIFLVEDESLIVMLIEDALADLGCEVAGVASRFDDAITKARNLAFDIAILDVNLNGLRSYPIAEIIRARGIPFVFATGYGATSVPDGLNAVPILQKPFAAPDLEQALRSSLMMAP